MTTYTVYFEGVGKVTDKAVQILIDCNGDYLDKVWLPKSQCQFQKKGNDYRVIMPAWLFNQKGFGATNWDGTHKFTYHLND